MSPEGDLCIDLVGLVAMVPKKRSDCFWFVVMTQLGLMLSGQCMCVCVHTVEKFGLSICLKKYSFIIHRGSIKVNINDHKGIYNVTKYVYFK